MALCRLALVIELAMLVEGLCDMLLGQIFSSNSEHSFRYTIEEKFVRTAVFVTRRDARWRYDDIQFIREKPIATGPLNDYRLSKLYWRPKEFERC